MAAVVLGCRGQLGGELSRRLPGATVLDRGDVDATDPGRLRRILTDLAPTLVFNATSFNRVDLAQSDPLPAFAVNAIAVREMAAICRDLDCPFVHFSTNYVFGRDAERRRPYRESDLPGPINVYGVCKLLGEELALSTWPRTLILRTAALIGRPSGSRNNFLENMLAKAEAGETVRVVDDQTLAPTATTDLASAAMRLVEAGATGVYHFNGPEPATWYELAKAFFDLVGMGDRLRPATTAEIGAPARRPSYSIMANERYAAHGFPPPMAWRDAVAAYARQREAERIDGGSAALGVARGS